MSEYRLVFNGSVYRIENFRTVGMWWWKRKEWVEETKRVVHPAGRICIVPREWGNKDMAMVELEKLRAYDKGFKPVDV